MGGEGGGEWFDLGVWGVEGLAGDFFAVDFDALEEGLVEEPSFGRVGLEIRGLSVGGEGEREFEGFQDGVVFDFVSLE